MTLNHKIALLIFIIQASIFFTGNVLSHPTKQATMLTPSDPFGQEVYNAENIKTLDNKKVMKIIKIYYPEAEMGHMAPRGDLEYSLDRFRISFNRYLRRWAKPKMTFREYLGLRLFKTYAHKFLHPNDIKEDHLPHTAFEVARALISVGERVQHHEVDLRLNFQDDTTESASASDSSMNSNTVNGIEVEKALWRGEVRKKTDIDDFLNTKTYSTGDHFVSFSKSRHHAMGFMVLSGAEDDQVRVVYKYKNPGPVYHLDLARVYSDTDHEDEVILYPMTEFKIVSSEDLSTDDGLLHYKLIHIVNEKIPNFDNWRRSNYEILKSYFNSAREMSTFQSAALEPRDPSKSPLKRLLQKLVPCIH